MPPALVLVLALSAPLLLHAVDNQQGSTLKATNPIRKVVTLLQNMQAKVTAEGEKEQDMHDKYMCYCQTNGGALSASMAEAKSKIESLESALQEATEKKKQTESDLTEHQASRSEAKAAMAEATALREKEAASFASEEADFTTNLEALTKAITAIENGMSGAFLQTVAANSLRRFAMERAELSDEARQELLAFLSNTESQGYVPQSGEITGILKEMKDEMAKSLAEATADEKEAIATYESLISSKTKEVDVLTAQIEEEQRRVGALGVDIATMSNDLEDTKGSLSEDGKFLLELEKGCKTKEGEWEEIKRMRADELVALAETIKLLNDDASLELFKKTLPGSASSFVQLNKKAASARASALATIRALGHHSKGGHLRSRPELDLIALALSGKKIGFDKVIKMIDEMVANLNKEQLDDDSKKEYCSTQLDLSEDKKKFLEVALKDSETAIAEMEGSISTLTEEIAALEAGIKALDKSVADATAQRKSEHDEYTELMTDNANAKEVLLWARNRLYKFYAPKLYKAPPKTEEAPETAVGAALVQVTAHKQNKKDAPPPPPETFGPYTKKTEDSNGVVAMMDLLIKDLDKEMTEADVTEKDSQEAYEGLMAEAGKKRADDSKSISDKSAAKAAEEEALEAEKDNKVGAAKELDMAVKYIHSLHGECDWLMQYYDVRKDARTSEIDALGKAKAVLNGADYSLMQTDQRLRR